MTSENTKAAQRGAGGFRKSDQAAGSGKIIPETNLATLQAQYLSEVFALPGETAAVLAELAFGGAA